MASDDKYKRTDESGKAVPFIEMMVTHASVLTILAISFERYYAICEPLKAGYICTKTRAFFICLCAWFLAGLLTSPMLFISQYELAQYSDGSWVPACLTPADTFWKELFYYMSVSVFFWVPLVVLLVLYSIIAIHLMADPGLKSSETFTHRARSQLILMLGTVVLSFFLCLMPFRVFLSCRTMSYVHSAINPVLYNLMSTKFRDGFIKVCGLRKRRMLAHGRNWGPAASSFSYSSSRRERDQFGSVQYHYRRSSDFSDTTTSFLKNSKIFNSESTAKKVVSETANSNGKCSPSLIYSPKGTSVDFPTESSSKNHSESAEALSQEEENFDEKTTQSLPKNNVLRADFPSKLIKSKSEEEILRTFPKKIPPDKGKTFSAFLDPLLVPIHLKDFNAIYSTAAYAKAEFSGAKFSESSSSVDEYLIRSSEINRLKSSKIIKASRELNDSHIWL